MAPEAADQYVEFAVAVEVAEVRRHVAVGFSEGAETRAGGNSKIFECPVLLVVIQVVPGRVVCDDQVGPAVAIVVSPDHAHAVELSGIVNTRFL